MMKQMKSEIEKMDKVKRYDVPNMEDKMPSFTLNPVKDHTKIYSEMEHAKMANMPMQKTKMGKK